LLVDSSFLSQLFFSFFTQNRKIPSHSLTPTESVYVSVCVCEREREWVSDEKEGV